MEVMYAVITQFKKIKINPPNPLCVSSLTTYDWASLLFHPRLDVFVRWCWLVGWLVG